MVQVNYTKVIKVEYYYCSITENIGTGTGTEITSGPLPSPEMSTTGGERVGVGIVGGDVVGVGRIGDCEDEFATFRRLRSALPPVPAAD